jgi:hypothetical protein
MGMCAPWKNRKTKPELRLITWNLWDEQRNALDQPWKEWIQMGRTKKRTPIGQYFLIQKQFDSIDRMQCSWFRNRWRIIDRFDQGTGEIFEETAGWMRSGAVWCDLCFGWNYAHPVVVSVIRLAFVCTLWARCGQTWVSCAPYRRDAMGLCNTFWLMRVFST